MADEDEEKEVVEQQPERQPDPNATTSTKVGDRAVLGDPTVPPTPLSDPEGLVSNRIEGTIQREPTAEELPPDAKVAPIAEQLAPNAAPIAVGAREQPEEIAGVEQPREGEKNVTADMSDPTKLLSETSDQHDEAERAAEDANRDAERGIASNRSANR